MQEERKNREGHVTCESVNKKEKMKNKRNNFDYCIKERENGERKEAKLRKGKERKGTRGEWINM
jgi:hypothetical protein